MNHQWKYKVRIVEKLIFKIFLFYILHRGQRNSYRKETIVEKIPRIKKERNKAKKAAKKAKERSSKNFEKEVEKKKRRKSME